MAEEGAIEQRCVEVQVFVDRLRIRVARDIGALQQRFDLAREDDPVSIVMVVELLHAQRVASEDEPLMARIPERQTKDARHVGEQPGTKRSQRAQKRLGV